MSDLTSKTVYELTPEEILSEVAEYFDQDFNKEDGNWRFLPSHCPEVASKVREAARRLEEAQQSNAEAAAKALEEARAGIDAIDDGEQPAYRHCQEYLGEKAAEYRAKAGRKDGTG